MASGIAGTYDIVADTPIGRQRGSAVITETGAERVSAEVDMGVLGRDSMCGTCGEDGRFRASGERRQFPFGTVAYRIEGTVAGDRLTARLESKIATIEITGTRRSS